MAKEVKIPVKVTGSEKAQSDLKKTGAAVKDVGGAGARAATGTRQATSATKAHTKAQTKAAPAVKKTTKAVNQFDDSAKTAVTGILGQFSPALASLGNIAVDVAKGITKMSGALVGMLAIGAAVSGLIALFRKIKEAAQAAAAALEKATKAREEFASQQREPAGQIAADLQRMGAYSPENFKKAIGTFVKTMGEGVARGKAAALAAPSMLAKLKPWQIARLAAAGLEPETPEQAEQMHKGLQADQETRRKITLVAERAKESPEGRAAMIEAAAFKRELKQQPRFLEKTMGITHDAILLGLAKRTKAIKEDAGIERIDELLAEYNRLKAEYEKHAAKRKIQMADYERTTGKPAAQAPRVGSYGLGKMWHLRQQMEALQPLVDLSESMKEAGIHDVTGPLRDEGVPDLAMKSEANAFSPETRKVIVNINNNQTTVNQGTAYNIDEYGLPWTARPLTPEIIEDGPYGP